MTNTHLSKRAPAPHCALRAFRSRPDHSRPGFSRQFCPVPARRPLTCLRGRFCYIRPRANAQCVRTISPAHLCVRRLSSCLDFSRHSSSTGLLEASGRGTGHSLLPGVLKPLLPASRVPRLHADVLRLDRLLVPLHRCVQPLFSRWQRRWRCCWQRPLLQGRSAAAALTPLSFMVRPFRTTRLWGTRNPFR